MENPDQSSQDRLCAEILDEARRESEKLARHAHDEADALIAKAGEESDRLRQERLAQARAEAARNAELILATVPIETHRQRSAGIEALLQTILEQARQQLASRQGFDYRETLVALATEAMERMVGDSFVAKLSAADRAAFGKALAEEIPSRLARSSLRITCSDEPTVIEGGLMVQDDSGRQVWDNRLAARLERMWPELRRQLAVRTRLIAASPTAGASP